MLQLSMKCLALVWGISVLFATESMSASVTEPTAEPDKTTKEPISAHVAHNGTETQPAASHPTHDPAEVSVSATAAAAEVHVSTTVKMEHTTTLVAMSTTATGEAKTSHIITISDTAKPTESHTTVIGTTSSTPTTSAAETEESVSTAQPDVASSIFSSSTPAHATQASVSSSRSPSSTSITTARPTSGAATMSESISTSEPLKTSTSSAELSHTPQPVSVTKTHNATSEFPDTAGSSSTTETPTVSFSTNSATNAITNASTSSAGIYIAREPKRSLIPSAKATTAAPSEAPATTSTEVQPCSTRGIVKHCLIAIASLAALATIFMVSTVILCTKLSARKYKLKKPQQTTEMMCISALLPETSYTYRRQRNPVTNGVLVIHGGGDSDEDGGDNVTLSSFLPENERYV